MTWLTVALIASFLFGTTNFIDRFLVEKRIKDPFFVSILGGVAAMIAAIVIVMIRGLELMEWSGIAILLFGGFASIVALVPWYKAIKLDDTSRVVPYFQLIPVVVLILSYVLLGEELTKNQLIGFALIITGGLSLAIERSSRELFKIRRSFWYILASIALWAPVAVLFKVVAVGGSFWDAFVYESVGAGLGALAVWWYAKTDMREGVRMMTASTWGVVGTNEAFYLLARGLQFYAVLIGPTALVSVVGGIQPLFALIIGLILSKWFPSVLREDIRQRTIVLKLVAIVVIFAGIAYINI